MVIAPPLALAVLPLSVEARTIASPCVDRDPAAAACGHAVAGDERVLERDVPPSWIAPPRLVAVFPSMIVLKNCSVALGADEHGAAGRSAAARQGDAGDDRARAGGHLHDAAVVPRVDHRRARAGALAADEPGAEDEHAVLEDERAEREPVDAGASEIDDVALGAARLTASRSVQSLVHSPSLPSAVVVDREDARELLRGRRAVARRARSAPRQRRGAEPDPSTHRKLPAMVLSICAPVKSD